APRPHHPAQRPHSECICGLSVVGDRNYCSAGACPPLDFRRETNPRTTHQGCASRLAALGPYPRVWPHRGRFAGGGFGGGSAAAAYGVERLRLSKPSPPVAVLVALVTVTSVALTAGGLAVASAGLDAWSRSGSILVEEYLRMPGVPRVVEGAPLTYDRLASYA